MKHLYKIMLTTGRVVEILANNSDLCRLSNDRWVYVFEPSIARYSQTHKGWHDEWCAMRFGQKPKYSIYNDYYNKLCCDTCGCLVCTDDNKFNFEFLAVTPASHGGDWIASNIRCICKNCESAEKKALVLQNKILRKKSKLSRRVREHVASFHGGKCAICKSTDSRKGGMHIDHIIPISRGGGDEIENLQLLCKKCNDTKGAMLPILQNRTLANHQKTRPMIADLATK